MNSWMINGVLGLLALLSVITWSIAIIKHRRLKQADGSNQHFEKTLFAQNSLDSMVQLAQQNDSDYAVISAAALQELAEARSSSGEISEWRNAVERKVIQLSHELLARYEAGLSELGTIATLSPFVGLFGTVWGIMNALKTIAATGNATIETVSGPIGEALVTTAIGIATALPAAAFFNYFSRQIKLRAVKFDQFGEHFLKTVLTRSR